MLRPQKYLTGASTFIKALSFFMITPFLSGCPDEAPFVTPENCDGGPNSPYSYFDEETRERLQLQSEDTYLFSCRDVDGLMAFEHKNLITSLTLETNIDLDNFNFSQFENLAFLTIRTENIHKLDISNNSWLRRLTLDASNILELDISSSVRLTSLTLNTPNLHTLSLPGTELWLSLENMTSLKNIKHSGLALGGISIHGDLGMDLSDFIDESGPSSIHLFTNDLKIAQIGYIENLTYLEIKYHSSPNLDVTRFPKLNTLVIHESQLEDLFVIGAPILKKILLRNSSVGTFDTSGVENLIDLHIANTKTQKVNTSFNQALEKVGFQDFSGSVNFEKNTLLTDLWIVRSDLFDRSVDLSNTQVTDITLRDVPINEVLLPVLENINNTQKLQNSRLEISPLLSETQFSIQGGQHLQSFWFTSDHQDITQLTGLKQLKGLRKIQIDNTKLTQLDLHLMDHLYSMYFSNSKVQQVKLPPHFFKEELAVDKDKVWCDRRFDLEEDYSKLIKYSDKTYCLFE